MISYRDQEKGQIPSRIMVRLTTVSLGRVSKAGLGLVRFLAQNHSSRHSTIGICRWQCDAPDDSRFSRKLCKNQFSCRIHHRPARYRQYEGIPPGFINETFVFQDKSHPDSAPSTGGSQQLCALQNGGELVTLENFSIILLIVFEAFAFRRWSATH